MTDSNGQHPLFSFQHDTEDGPEAKWSPDDSRILVFGEDILQVRSAADGSQVWEAQHENDIFAAHWNKTGTQILSISSDGTARVWDSATGREMFVLDHSPDQVLPEAMWSQDESRILTRFREEVGVWDARSGVRLHRLTASSRRFYRAVWCMQESHILTTEDNTVCLWNPASASVIRRFELADRNSRLLFAEFNPDESKILVYRHEDPITVLNAADFRVLLTLDAPAGFEFVGDYRDWHWSPDGLKLAAAILPPHQPGTGRRKGKMLIYDAASGQIQHRLEYSDAIWRTAWSRDSQRLIAGSQDGSLCIWNAKTSDKIQRFQHESSVEEFTWLEDEKLLITRSAKGHIRILDEDSAAVLFETAYDGTTNSAALNKGRTRLLTSWIGNDVEVWAVDISWRQKRLPFAL